MVLLLRRLALVSQKVIAAKSYFNLLRDLQRVVMTAEAMAIAEVAKMPAGGAEDAAQRWARRQELEAVYRAKLTGRYPGEVEGDKIATLVRHRLVTEDVFCAAAAFLQLEVSRRGSSFYIRGESTEFLETKRNRDPFSIESEVNLKTLSANLARPDLERGKVEQDAITYGYNLLAKRYNLFILVPTIMQWIKEGESLSQPRRKIDVRAQFRLKLRDYDVVMVMARQMGYAKLRTRRASPDSRYALNAANQERVVAEAARRGYTPHRMLNTILRDFFTLIDKNERARAKAESAQAGTNLKAPNADEPGRA